MGRIEELKGKNGRNTEDILLKTDVLKDSPALDVLSEFYGVEKVESIPEDDIDYELIKQFPISFAKRFRILPISKDNGTLKVVFAPPQELYALDEVRSRFNCSLETYIALERVLTDSINRVYEQGKDVVSEDINEGSGLSDMEFTEPQDLIEAEDEAPIIKFINTLLFQAVREHASDIHIECFEKEVLVRFRKDGILHDVTKVPKTVQSSVISRVKIMSELDIAERRKPQDGSIRLKIGGRDIDVRVSTVPTSWGESVVMRLLYRSSVLMSFEQLGLEGEKLETVESLIKRPHGIILVTGPTGSGKTTSLYAALQRINLPDKKIITIEDPVEYQIQGINQIQVNTKVGLTFANGLRSILRQDPDVILVGEIRDRETADISMNASLTGHLVFSTLHTNDSVSAVTRLADMGVESFLIASTLSAVIAQRLVRILCTQCREQYVPVDEELGRIGFAREACPEGKIYRAKGCQECMETGFSGRIAIFEILLIDDELKNTILTHPDSSTLKEKALRNGLITLRMDGADKVAKGITSIDEVLRVTEEELAES
ncbi:MAG: type II secretion system protein GspE [Candidatus Dadabacteria bacterium]|nr:type II secretion system protein GspE [Candidatus Dadabacteria bacterium]MYB26978.1 type II secretion system protein GspE [Candidatus Dadabacteria bacterium]